MNATLKQHRRPASSLLKKVGVLLVLTILTLSLTACGKKSIDSGTESTETPGAEANTSKPNDTPTLADSNPKPLDPIPVNLYFIALEDNGQVGEKIGCNDSAFAMPITIRGEIPEVDQPEAVLDFLLRQEQFEGPLNGLSLDNTLANSELSIRRVQVKDGTAEVDLKGQLSLAGVCDSPRVSAQLEKTLLQFPAIDRVEIRINGELLEEALSEK